MRESTKFLFFGFGLSTVGLAMIINPIHAIAILLIVLGITQRKLAKEYSISFQHISQIISRKRWQHLGGIDE